MADKLTKIERARARACMTSVFFPMLVMGTPTDPDEDIPTMATDGVSIWYNTSYVERQEVDVVISLLFHELLHIVKRHVPRMGNRDPQLWNQAADYDVNGDLVQSGFKLWAGALHDKQFYGKSVETIYDILARDADKRPKQGDTAGEDLKQPQNQSPEQKERAEQNVKERVAFAATQARRAGQMSEALERIVGEMLAPSIPWEAVLLLFMLAISSGGEDWCRRSRMALGRFLPAQRSRSMGEIVLAVDTSGSISDDVFRRVASELDYIADVVKPEAVRVVWCDSRVHGEQMFERGEDIQLKPKGGGGTDMRVALEFAAQYDPAVVILFTDGYTPWPNSEPNYPLLVLCTTEVVAPIGETIHVKV